MASQPSSSSSHTTLVLPLLPTTYPDPTPLLPTVYRTVVALTDSTTSFLVLFSTPDSFGEQLYPRLRSNAVTNWSGLQVFLGKVYACLAAAQWTSGKVLLDVEVGFMGEQETIQSTGGGHGQIVVLEGYEDLTAGDLLKHPQNNKRVVKCPSLLASADTYDLPTASSSHLPVIALGGTFDHLHAAHKLLLHLALFLASRKLIVGVMADSLLSSKNQSQLVQNLEERISRIESFLIRHGARRNHEGGVVEIDVVEIQDPYGPTAWDPDIQALVVSQETLAGGKSVNQKRREKSLPELELFVIHVIASKLDDGETQKKEDGTRQVGVDAIDGEDAYEREGKVKVRIGDGDDLRTLDLSGEMDETRLKELKMGSTAIRQWIAMHKR